MLVIDQHRKQLTVRVRQEPGSVMHRRQVNTTCQRVGEFFDDLRERSREHEGYLCVSMARASTGVGEPVSDETVHGHIFREGHPDKF